MELKIIWSKESLFLLNEIYTYYTEIVGSSTSKLFVKNLKNKIKLLSTSPYLGKEIQNKNEFRYLVHSFYIIVYKVYKSDNKINIILIFDNRQNPNILLKHLKNI